MSRKRDLTSAEWIELGNDFKACQALLWKIVQTVQKTARIDTADAVMKHSHGLDRIKSALENVMDRQHPEMRGMVNATFNGPALPVDMTPGAYLDMVNRDLQKRREVCRSVSKPVDDEFNR
jgi:hypothetical protein